LQRQGNAVRPTPKGERLLELIRPLLSGLDSTRDVLAQQDGAPPPQLTLVSNLRVLVDEISRALRQFQRRYPAVRLKVLYTGIDEVQPLVVAGEADVTLTLEPGPDSPPARSLTYEPAGEVDYLLITPPKHPLVRKRTLHLEQIVEFPLVLGEPGAYSRHRVQEIMHRYGLSQQLRIAVETSSDEYTLNCVRAGLGVGITVGTGHGHLYRGLAVRSLRHWFGTARVGFLWKQGAHLPLVQRDLADAIQACVAQRKNKSSEGGDKGEGVTR
jgi:DNA-binding transcriptional LysR family regulator